jgi:hypothetical protein
MRRERYSVGEKERKGTSDGLTLPHQDILISCENRPKRTPALAKREMMNTCQAIFELCIHLPSANNSLISGTSNPFP